MDRPEMLSDRLGYPSTVGDEDYKRLAANMEIAAVTIKRAMLHNIKKEHLASLIQRAHLAGLHVEVSNSDVVGTTHVMISVGFHMDADAGTVILTPNLGVWNVLQWAREEEIVT